ncbi:MAG: alpha/beta hydrolase [Chloroflexota bacterium]
MTDQRVCQTKAMSGISTGMEYTEGKFTGHRNLNLYYQCWLLDRCPKAVLVIAHGLAEHCGRYANLVNYFVPRDYAIFSFDQRGHGKSEGLRGHVERFSDYLSDLDTFLNLVRLKCGDARIFLIGHSMGGTIATAYAVEHQDALAGLVVSGAVLKVNSNVPPSAIAVSQVLSVLLPKTGVMTLDASALSRDEAVVDAYRGDPLVYRDKIRARLGVELMKAMESLERQMPRVKLPTLIMHGTADRLSPPAGSQMLYQRLGSSDKTLKLYDGFYHEIFNEPGHQQVLADLETWLASHV